MKKRSIAAAMALTLALGTGVGAYAAANSTTISALLNPDLKIVYNGVEQHLKDAAGNPVYPISYNNTTFLPVRAISDLIDLPIDFDGARYAVIMGATEAQPAPLVKLTNTGGTQFSSIIRDSADLNVTTKDGTQNYSTGIYWNIWNGSGSAAPERPIRFNVKGYSTLTFTAWADVDTEAIIYNQDGKVFSSFRIPANSTVTKTMTLDATTTQIGFAGNGPLGSTGTMKILDPTVK